MAGIKHLIQCHCILPQYRRMKNPIFHKFTVYSKWNKDGGIIDKISQCNNCGVYHSVYEVCKSEIMKDYEDVRFLISIDDIEDQLPDNVSRVLKKNECDLPTWENVLDLYQNETYDIPIVISRNTIENSTYVKSLMLCEKNRIVIDNHKIENQLEME